MACTANALSEQTSYEEFVKAIKKDTVPKEIKKPVTSTKKMAELQVKKAEKILSGFNPEKGGALNGHI